MTIGIPTGLSMNPENLGKLLNPRSLAIAGPNDKNNAGAQALANAIASGFQGAIYPVNPNYQSLQGLKCYASLTALPEVPDTVVVAVPTLGAMKILHEAAAVGAPSIVFFNGGFTDAGNEAGLERHRELLEIAGRAAWRWPVRIAWAFSAGRAVSIRASSRSPSRGSSTAFPSYPRAGGS